jgi:DNA-binding LytR/AlgR family response regulator
MRGQLAGAENGTRKMNILICDDAANDALMLKKIIAFALPYASVQIFTSGAQALSFIRDKKPAVCFLDIIMPDMDGISLARHIREEGYQGPIIFFTAANNYAFQSYDVNAAYYLLKPPEKEKVISLLARLEAEQKAADTAGIMIKIKSLSKRLLFRDISHAEVIKHKVYFRLANGEELAVTSLFWEIKPKLLADSRFAQCHRSFVVNMDSILQIQGSAIIMNCGKKIPLSKSFSGLKKVYWGDRDRGP